MQMLGFPVARSTLCRCDEPNGVSEMPSVEALRASPVVYPMRRAGSSRLWVFTNLARPSTRYFRAVVSKAASVLGKNCGHGVDGWAPYRCFKEATLQTCYNHLLHRCHELETATRRPSSGTPSPCAIGAMLARSGMASSRR